MSDLHKILLEKVPSNILAQIVFLDKWEEPPNFKFMSKPERLQLMHRYLPLQVEPTETNYWIWFGAYSSKDQQPVLNNLRVSRVMYELVHGPLKWPNGKDRRLVNALVETMADLNLYKFIPACGNRFRSMKEHIEANGLKINYSQLLSNQQKKTTDFNINQAFNTLVEYEEDFKNEGERKAALTALGHLPHIINSALEKFNEYQQSRKLSNIVEGDNDTSGITPPQTSTTGAPSTDILSTEPTETNQS